MQRGIKNRILRTGLLGFFVLAIFLIPVSLHNSPGTSGLVLSTVSAQAETAAKIGNSIMNALGYSILEFFAMFTRFGGLMLEKALEYTVFEMGGNVNTTTLGGTINTLWTLIRDICNLAFIFGFIYVGIRTIIDPESASTKRFLSRIIIGALLINFSLFFAKAIIDFSNFTAYQMYTSMVTDQGGSLTGTIMNNLRLTTFYDPQTGAATLAKNNSLSTYLAASLFLMITAFVFFAGALILVVRFVALILIMVASPLLFAATVFPQTEGTASDLWRKLLSYSFLAPVYLLLILISIKLVQGVGLSRSANFSEDFFSLQNNMTAILNFTIIIFFMISSLTIATKMGGKGADMAVGFANNIRGRVQGAIGRNTIGRGTHWLRERYEKEDAKAASFKWDRSKGLGANLRGSINKFGAKTLTATGADRGIRETLKAGEHAKFGGPYSYEDDEKYTKEQKTRRAGIIELGKFEKMVGDSLEEDTANPGKQKLKTLDTDKQIELERTIADAAVKDIEELKQEQRKALVALMTDSQIEAIQKSDKLTDSEKADLGAERQKLVAKLYEGGKADDLSKAAIGHLTSLGSTFLSDEKHAMRLTSSQMDDLKKKLTKTEYEKVNGARKDALKKLAGGTPIDGKDTDFILNQKPGEVAKMHEDVLIALGPKLSANVLGKVVQDGTHSKAAQATMLTKIQAVIDNPDSSLTEKELTNIANLDDFIRNNPLGKQFGK